MVSIVFWIVLRGYVLVLENFDSLCVDCTVNSCDNGDEGVDFPTLGINCTYEGVIFVLLCFDGFLRVSIILCEFEFYYLDCQVGGRYRWACLFLHGTLYI